MEAPPNKPPGLWLRSLPRAQRRARKRSTLPIICAKSDGIGHMYVRAARAGRCNHRVRTTPKVPRRQCQVWQLSKPSRPASYIFSSPATMAPTCSPSYSLIVIILTSLILFVPLATLSPPKAMLNVHIHRGASNKVGYVSSATRPGSAAHLFRRLPCVVSTASVIPIIRFPAACRLSDILSTCISPFAASFCRSTCPPFHRSLITKPFL